MKQFQQGDVYFQTTKIPNPVKFERILDPIVQYGEATGHKHQLWEHGMDSAFFQEALPTITEIPWKLFRDKKTGERYLEVTGDKVELRHEEHKTINLPPGEYKIGIVKEYDHFKEEAREVID
jgi:hypothetical protein